MLFEDEEKNKIQRERNLQALPGGKRKPFSFPVKRKVPPKAPQRAPVGRPPEADHQDMKLAQALLNTNLKELAAKVAARDVDIYDIRRDLRELRDRMKRQLRILHYLTKKIGENNDSTEE